MHVASAVGAAMRSQSRGRCVGQVFQRCARPAQVVPAIRVDGRGPRFSQLQRIGRITPVWDRALTSPPPSSFIIQLVEARQATAPMALPPHPNKYDAATGAV